MSRLQIIFVDSSVLIAAAISSRGFARDLILSAFGGRCVVVLSSLVLEETERNLATKFPRALSAFGLFRGVWEASVVDPDLSMVDRVGEVIALKDAPIVAAAIKVGADFLATYDRKRITSIIRGAAWPFVCSQDACA